MECWRICLEVLPALLGAIWFKLEEGRKVVKFKGKFERRICRAMVSVRMRRRGEGRFSNVVRTSHREAAKTGFRRVEKRSRSKKSVFEVVMFLSHLVLVLVVVGF